MDENKLADKEPPSGENAIIYERVTKSNGEVTITRYSRGKLLGRGGFAKCYEITNLETKKIMAAKIIAKSSLNRSRAKQKLISEIKIHKALTHQHIVKFEHVFYDQENVYIMLEICSNQTLNELIKRRKRLTEMEVMYYLKQMVSALKYLHSNKIIHRDLKLGNLFLNDNMEIKLGDFGLATRLEYNYEKKKTICGTPNYIAPYILEGKGHSYEVDVWSIGVILYTQLIGKPPFETNEVKATYKRIKGGNYSFPDSVTISDNAKDIISRILVLDPAKRPTLENILLHPFMTNEPIPANMPRSTLACPPAKSFVEQNLKSSISQQNVPKLTPSASKIDKIPLKTDTAKEVNTKGSWQEDIMIDPETIRAKDQYRLKEEKKREEEKALKQPEQSMPHKKIQHAEIHVKKWVDYSTKYGLGYLLSDGSTGVYFNDATKIILEKNGEHFQYIEKRLGYKIDTIQYYKLTSYPEERELQKKVTLLQHFRNYLYADYKQEGEKERQPDATPCYVKKWMKTKHAIMFRLSNKIVQVNFTDKTEIILSSEQKLVTYINLRGEKSEYALATALDHQNAEMAKRLKYTKEILTHMLNGTNLPVNNVPESID